MDHAPRYIALFPEVPPAVHALRSLCDPLAAVVAPHLTLVFPFTSALDDTAIHAHMAACLPGHPARIRLNGITAHDDHLFLNVKEGNDACIALHDRLYTGPLATHHTPLFTFVPHMTVGRRPKDDDAALALLADWNGRGIEVRIAAAELRLMRVVDGGDRVIAASVPYRC